MKNLTLLILNLCIMMMPFINASAGSIIGAGSITCSTPSITLSSSDTASSYLWTKDGIPFATTSTINVTQVGAYGLTVNGSSIAPAVAITKDVTIPIVTLTGATNGAVLNCTTPSYTLGYAVSSGTVVSQTWSTTASSSAIVTSSAGTYNVTLNFANGCSATSNSITLTKDITSPAVSILGLGSGTINTTTPSISLSSSQTASSYAWTKNAVAISTTNSLVVTTAGAYSLTVTYANGCTATSPVVSITKDSTSTTPSTNASLTSLVIDQGTLSPVFNTSTTAYTVKLPVGTTTYPTITPTPVTGGSVNISKTTFPGTATITVTAADGVTTKTYTINFSINTANTSSISALGFNFQAVLRSSMGDVMKNKNINLKISITSDSIGNTILYSETHAKQTSAFGATSLVVGQGSVVKGTFASIDWAGGSRYLKIEYAEAGQSTFDLFSITQLMAVPYAIHAQTVEKETDPSFINSASSEITAADVARWNAAATQSQTSSAGNPTGTVIYFATSTPPAGYLVCDGSLISRTQYPALLAVIGVTYGIGDGLNTFGLPDLRGEFIRGYDNGRGVDASRAFGSYQTDELKSHSHNLITNGMGGGTVGPSEGGFHVGGGRSTPTTYTGGTETRPRNIALLPCIKY